MSLTSPDQTPKRKRDCQHPKEPPGRVGTHVHRQTHQWWMRNRDGEKPFTTLCSVYKILQFSEPNCAWTLTSNSCSRGLKTCEAERCKSPKDIVLYIGTLFFLNSALKAGLYQHPWESVLCNELFSLWSPSKQRKEIIFHNTSPRKPYAALPCFSPEQIRPVLPIYSFCTLLYSLWAFAFWDEG